MTFKFENEIWKSVYENTMIKISYKKKARWSVWKAGVKLESGTKSHILEAAEAAKVYVDNLKKGKNK